MRCKMIVQTTFKCAMIRLLLVRLEPEFFSGGMLLQMIIILFVLTLALTLILKLFVTPKYGTDVASRFLERLKYIPSQTALLSSTTLSGWLATRQTAKQSAAMFIRCCFHSTSSSCSARPPVRLRIGSSGKPTGIPVECSSVDLVGVSASYMASDLAEDTASRPYSKPSFR